MARQPSARQKQSTLTQIVDFLDPLPSSDEDPDGSGNESKAGACANLAKRKRATVSPDHYKPLSCKRRLLWKEMRPNGRQDTLTQNWARLSTPARSMKLEPIVLDSEDEDADDVGFGVQCCVHDSEDESTSPTIPESCLQSPHPSTTSTDTGTRPTSGPSTASTLRTPQKTQTLEIPSSQTPASIKLSNRKTQLIEHVFESPLQDRSMAKPPLESQCLLSSPQKYTADSQDLDIYESPTRRRTSREPRIWRRVTTIHDSQPEREGSSDLQSYDLTRPRAEPGPHLREASPLNLSAAKHHGISDNNEDITAEGYWPAQTYDPVNSALDRDAFRFNDAEACGDEHDEDETQQGDEAPPHPDKAAVPSVVDPGMDREKSYMANQSTNNEDTKAHTDSSTLQLMLPPHLSQISTTLSTQPLKDFLISSPPFRESVQLPSQLFSSSPFPLPPTLKIGESCRAGFVEDSEKATDLSLSPPPPIFAAPHHVQ